MYNNTQQYFNSHDGASLFYQAWRNHKQPVKQAIILLHRGHEHSGRMSHLVNELDLPDYDFFALDARGHGKSPGQRGDAPSFSACVQDLQYFVQHIQKKYEISSENIAVIGQSVGAVIAATWVHDYAPKLRALCLASPAFEIKLYVPFAKSGLNLLSQVRGNFFIQSYVKAKMLTHDEERAKSYERDPLIAKAISVRMLLGLSAAAERVVDDAKNIYVPTQVLCSGSDFVVEQPPQRQFYTRLAHPQKEFHVLEGFFHDTLGEKNRELAIAKIRRFIQQCFAQPYQAPQLLNADKIGASCAQAERLSTDLPKHSVKDWFWKLTKGNLKLGSRWSEALKIGEDTGYDSGSTLDFVYRNQTESQHLLGKVIDHQYLNAIGWKGIRVRKQHIEQLLAKYAKRLQDDQQSVKILDIAAGHGRYILDAIAQLKTPPSSALLRDYSDLNVAAGELLIEQRGLEKIAKFELGDAFNRDELAAIEPKANLAVVSGLYELFADNDALRQSLQGLNLAMEQGGYLIYTGQIWHPQQEFIARALTSHREGQAWVMRLRSQVEMDALVEQAGFSKVDQCIDEFGIFTVSVAQKL